MSEASPKVILDVKDISLSFGGVKAITDVSFDVRLGEVRAIIGPNGAGKTSMLNCINGFYHPQIGTISYKGEPRKRMAPYVAASQGIARTFQNVALFQGMTTLDNIMSGRTLRMKNFFWQMWRHGYLPCRKKSSIARRSKRLSTSSRFRPSARRRLVVFRTACKAC